MEVNTNSQEEKDSQYCGVQKDFWAPFIQGTQYHDSDILTDDLSMFPPLPSAPCPLILLSINYVYEGINSDFNQDFCFLFAYIFFSFYY